VTIVYQQKADNKIVIMSKGQDTVMLPLIRTPESAGLFAFRACFAISLNS
jgi:hypothetical protein